MSLQVWLPLIDDCKNLGLSDLTFTSVSNNISIQSNGKVGTSCYCNNSHTAGGLISDSQLKSLGSQVSMFAWVKLNDFNDNPIGIGGTHTILGSGYPAATGMGFNIIQSPANSSIRVVSVNTGNGSTRTWNTYYGSIALSTNTWYHIGFTYDGSYIRIYVNGQLDKTYSYTGQSNPADRVHVFSWAQDGTLASKTIFPHYLSVGGINDFRIYDNVLSTKEIKLLAQGLVAHYQLKGMGKKNYLKGSGKYTYNSPLVRNANDSSVMNDSYVYYDLSDLSATVPVDGIYTWVVESNGTPTSHPTTGTSGSSHYFSLWLQNTSTSQHYLWNSMGTSADGRHYGSVTIPAGTYKIRTNLYAADNKNYSIKLWNMKLIQGSYNPDDTWCPNSEDELYSNLNLGGGEEVDVSGFGNTGIKNSNFSTEDKSPRYGSSYKFTGSQYISCGRGAMVSDAMTVALWAYSSDWASFNSQLISCTEAGGWGLGYGANVAGHGFEMYNSGYYGVDLAFNSLAAGWHHFAVSYNGNTIIGYVDGVEKSRKTGVPSGIVYNASNGIFIGAEAGGNQTTAGGMYFNGNMSDVRIYGTALSATDIADLYKNSASITKDGKALAYVFHENNRNTVDKAGIMATNNFETTVAPTHKMKKMALGDGSAWARIHHLDVSKNTSFFTTSEVANCERGNRYSRMKDVDKFKAGTEYEFMLTYPSMKKTLPQGYTKLEYIEATGSQFINTGVTGHARWEFDIQFTKTNKRQLMGYFGHGDEYWGCQTDGKYGLFAGSTIGKAGDRHTIVHDYQSGAATLWVQNQSMGVGGTTNLGSNQYQLFDIMSDPQFCCHVKLWRCKCVQNGSLIRDFIPAMRNSDGYIGLYDIVNNAFYGNAGSGYFLCNYSYLEYIQSNGNEYIDTGVAPTNDTEVEIAFTPTGGLTENSIFGSAWSASGFFLMFYQNKIRWHSGGYSVDIGSYQVGDRVVCHCANNYIIVNNVRYNIAGGTNTTNNIVLLGDMGYNSSKRGIGKIEYVKIWKSGSLVRNYVPCNYGGSIGMIDKVTGSFYGNAGSGAFKYGHKNGSYQWLEYVQNATGLEQINTGYPAPEGFLTEAVIEYVTQSGGYVLGSHNTAAPWGRNGFGLNSLKQWELGSGDTCPASSTTVALNTKYAVQASSIKGNSFINVNGNTVVSNTDISARCSSNVFIFRNQYEQHHNSATSQIKIYSLKFYLPNGTLIRDFQPCINPNGKVGFYDKITKKFYGNSGGGYLIAGPTKESLPLYNRWIQTSSPNAASVSGFKPITTAWTAHNYGLRKHGTDCVYNCDNGGTWYAPIGQINIWEGGIPAADGTKQTSTELWVRTDRLSETNQFKIYNGSMTAKDYIEI